MGQSRQGGAGRVDRTVEVAPERLAGWLDGFAGRHGASRWDGTAQHVTVTAEDGAVARCAVPFPPLQVEPAAPYGGLLAHAAADRRVGVLLVRAGGYAAGVFDGARLLESKVGSRYVQGRSAAGGWSQQRFARRRADQARKAYAAAADTAARVLLPAASELHALVTGGERRAVTAVLDDRRLQPLRRLVSGRVHDVPDPRQRVLEQMPARFRAVRIEVTDAPG